MEHVTVLINQTILVYHDMLHSSWLAATLGLGGSSIYTDGEGRGNNNSSIITVAPSRTTGSTAEIQYKYSRDTSTGAGVHQYSKRPQSVPVVEAGAEAEAGVAPEQQQ